MTADQRRRLDAMTVMFSPYADRVETFVTTRGDTMNDLGMIAYEAYLASSGGVSLVSGAELPTWVDQAPEIKDAWRAAAEAVRRFVQPVED